VTIASLLDRLTADAIDNVGEPLPGSLDLNAVPAKLPDDYLATLSRFNGFTVHGGANRLFGIRGDAHMDIRVWNSREKWRFAWADRPSPFYCIGETAFGDQYALRLSDDGDVFRPEVFLLEGNFLEPEVIGENFQLFLEQELVRNAETPWDDVAVEAVRRYGPIDVANNWVYTPSVALGGPEDVANLVELDCFTAMTIAGDIASAIADADPAAQLQGVEPYEDGQGRSRLRVIFRL
jgi:hypothetical protein